MDSSSKKCPQRSTLPLVLLCLSLSTRRCLSSNIITANQSLSGNQTLTSFGGNFKLGFFTPGNSSYSYIGIWYGKISTRTIVWVANRDKPIRDRFSNELKISGGNLLIVNDSGVPAWTTSLTSSSGSSSMVAVLMDDGNFALKDGPNASNILWQSFDHSTHTWLPGAKIAYNKHTSTSQLLTSWKNQDDPATGLFSLQLFPSSEYFLYWNRSNHYWASGTWNNQTKLFNQVPEMRLNYIYDFKFVDNADECYFTYSVYSTANTISRLVMDLSGQMKQLSWLPSSQQWNLFFSLPRQQCEVHNLCGPFGVCSESTDNFCKCLPGFNISSVLDWSLSDWSGGCKRNTKLNCMANATNAENDRFLRNDNMNLPTDSQTLSVGSAAGCETACLKNCSCTAYAFDNNICQIWIGNLFNAKQLTQSSNGGKTLYLRLAASDVPGPSKKSNVTRIVAGSIGVVVAVALFGIWRWRRTAIVKIKAADGSLIAFAYRDLQVATKNFSEKLGFGSVFKGTLPDSTHIAVKKLESVSQGEKQFRAEVSTIGTIQHVNLVRLRGFCSEGNKKLLVYDYMPSGSLDVHLFNRKDSKCLDWKTRYQIALGIARGLAYLHEKCRDCIIHCDIKPENILLDAEFCPKVADFGLAKLMGRKFSRVLTTMRGTRGYLAPEWISGVAITAKADVYSYGMMLFEFISGRRNSEQAEDGMIKFFPTWAANKIVEGGDLLGLLDPFLERNADAQELTKVCKVACWCIQDEETRRPSMGQVVQILEGALDVNLPQVPRALQLFVQTQEHVVFFVEESSSNQCSQTQQYINCILAEPKQSAETTSQSQ